MSRQRLYRFISFYTDSLVFLLLLLQLYIDLDTIVLNAFNLFRECCVRSLDQHLGIFMTILNGKRRRERGSRRCGIDITARKGSMPHLN